MGKHLFISLLLFSASCGGFEYYNSGAIDNNLKAFYYTGKSSAYVVFYIEYDSLGRDDLQFLKGINRIIFNDADTLIAEKTIKRDNEFVSFLSVAELPLNSIEKSNQFRVYNLSKMEAVAGTLEKYKQDAYSSKLDIPKKKKGIFTVFYREADTLGFLAIRIHDTEEYFPTSEELRVNVLSKKGKPLYESDREITYLMVINPLLPQDRGEIHQYGYYLKPEGIDSASGNVYQTEIMLPVRPLPYIIRIDLKY